MGWKLPNFKTEFRVVSVLLYTQESWKGNKLRCGISESPLCDDKLTREKSLVDRWS